MEDQKQTSFTFEIDNFSEKEDAISSPIFISGGCEWFVEVYPKGNCIEDQLSVYLYVARPESLRRGWKRRAKYSFTVLNQSGREFKRSSGVSYSFCAHFTGWGYPKMLPLSKLKEKGFVENNKLIIKVEVKVVEVVHDAKVTGIELEEREKNLELMESKLEDVSLERKKAYIYDGDGSRVRKQLEERIKKLELMESKLEEVSLERKKADDDVVSRVQQLEERVKNDLKLMESKLEVSLERKRADESRVKQLEESVKNLEMMVSDLKVELEKEKAKSYADGFVLVA